MTLLLASGYHGPPELTPVRTLTQWAPDPWALAVLAVVGVAYLAGTRRIRSAGGSWPAARTVAFLAGGLGLSLIATSSFLAVYWPILFYVRAVQTVLLLLAVPLFIAMGRPLTLIIDAAPRFGRRLQAALTGRVARAVTFPAVVALVLVLTPVLLYFTPWYAAGFDSELVRQITYLALVLPGLVFFWTLLRVDPVPRQYPYLVSLWVSAAEVVGDAVLGLAVIADHNLIAGSYYHALARPWGPSLATDQVLGGGTLWILGDIIGLPFLAAVLIAMMREDESQARVIDARLDAQEAAIADRATADPTAIPTTADPTTAVELRPGQAGEAAVGSSQAADASAAPTAAQRPWWETDPRIAGRFSPVERSEGGS